MKRVISGLLVVLLAATPAAQADAQILKGLFGRDKGRSGSKKTTPKSPAQRQPATSTPARRVTPAAKARPAAFSYPGSEKKDRYRIDVLVQLYLDELVKGGQSVYKVRIPEKALAGLNFYEGIKLAIDTLRDEYEVDVHIHDITAAGRGPQQLVATHALDSADLIIGVIPAAQIPAVADYARTRGVNFVSALSPSDAGVRNNPYFTLLQPTLQTHCEWLASHLDRGRRRQRAVVMYRAGNASDVSARRSFLGEDSSKYQSLSVTRMPTAATLRGLFDSTETNTIVATVMDIGYADSLLRYLNRNFPNHRFEVYGMPTWRSMSSFKKAGAYPGIAVYFTAPFFFDASTASGQSVAKAYAKNFGGKPGDMVYRGYETIHWYAYLLHRYGTVFNSSLSDAGSAGFTRFKIQLRYDRDGELLYAENRHLHLYRYQSGGFTVE